jgi:hypothetical protein
MQIQSSAATTVLLAGLVLSSGCASSSTATPKAERKPGHWVYLPPETGSNLPRRIWQNDDGTMVDPTTGRVYQGDKDTMADLQRLQSVAPASRGN